ncbi:hypothetical protein QUA41_09650 [Microcoleus sp. Pol11C1]|uniref:hypothetical protein n=1 Tax=unclassified Microcoleus TaxID=2642155 RepID=UPI002FD09E49
MQFWLKVFLLPELSVGFNRLITFMNRFPAAIPVIEDEPDFHFSSVYSEKKAIVLIIELCKIFKFQLSTKTGRWLTTATALKIVLRYLSLCLRRKQD